MQNPEIKFTYRDYLLLPEDKRRELIGGDFYVVPSPGFRHQTISRDLEMLLWNFVKENDLGVILHAPFDVVLSDEDVVQPDIIFVSRENMGIITERNAQGAPDLVVEILSPSTAQRDRELKLRLYVKFGVREYWIVDPEEQSIQVLSLKLSLTAEGYWEADTYKEGTLYSSLLPGLEVSITEVFEGIRER